MNLAQAVETLTAEYPLATDDAATPVSMLDLTSGGIRTDRDVEPALWSSGDLAIKAWLRETRETLRDLGATSVRLVDGPHLDKWNMTVMDIKNTHRVAEPRYSVTSKLGLFTASTQEKNDMSSTNSLSERVNKLEDKVLGPKEERDAAAARKRQGEGTGGEPDQGASVLGERRLADGPQFGQDGEGNPTQQADGLKSSANTAPNPDASVAEGEDDASEQKGRGHGRSHSKK